MKTLPNPCPTLREGLSLGAQAHAGFCEVWNWIIDFFRNLKENVVTKVNDRTGKVNIVAGNGIDVVASGGTITIGLGSGESKDEDNPSGSDPNGGGMDDDPGLWTDAEPAETGGFQGGGSGGGMFAWDEATRTIGAGGCMVGWMWVAAGGTGVADMADGAYSVHVSFTSGGVPTAEVVAENAEAKIPTDTDCWIPIYTISEGKVIDDLRGAFAVSCWR